MAFKAPKQDCDLVEYYPMEALLITNMKEQPVVALTLLLLLWSVLQMNGVNRH